MPSINFSGLAVRLLWQTFFAFGLYVGLFFGLGQLPMVTADVGVFLDQFGAVFLAATLLIQTLEIAISRVAG